MAKISVPEIDGEIDGLLWKGAEQTGNNITLTTVLHATADKGAAFNNGAFASLRDDSIGEYGFYAGHSIKYGQGDFDQISLTAIDLIVAMKNKYYSTFTVNDAAQTFPLERKIQTDATEGGDEDYLTWWNHNVIGPEAESALSTPQEDQWKAITDGKPPAGFPGLYWAKSNQALKAAEKILLTAHFPGTQAFQASVETVTQTIYSRTESKIRNMTLQSLKRRVPKDHLGIPFDQFLQDPETWLIIGSSYRKNFGWYEGQIKYLYAAGGHFTELYPPADESVF